MDQKTGQPLVFNTAVPNPVLTQDITGAITTMASQTLTSQPIDIGMNTSNLPPGMTFALDPNVTPALGPGGTATFNATLTLNSVPFVGTFQANFVDLTNGTILGSVPFVINLPGAAPVTQPSFVKPPIILSARQLLVRNRPTTFVLSFSSAMNKASVEDVHNYALRGPNGRLDPIRLATYNAQTNSITLRTKFRIRAHRSYTLEVYALGSKGVKSKAGVGLDGMKTGQPGNNYYAKVYDFNLTPGLL
jgi:hypothetical protein